MIVVLSDLHFSEAQSTQIGKRKFNRNLPSEIFRAYFAEINQFAKINQIEKVDLVLAGDILEISRSAIWLDDKNRPYISNSEVITGSDEEKTILSIIDAIRSEEKVDETLKLFQSITDYFEVDVELHIIMGNHDRLGNATSKIRSTVRELFGIYGPENPFENYLIFHDDQNKPFCLIRHGHEYDPSNFSINLRQVKSIPANISADVYGNACFGDITTIEFGAALSWYFVKEHGEKAILNDHNMLAIYERLMAFDDVRPTTAWLSYLLSTPGVSRKETWRLIKPSFTNVINTLSRNRLFAKTLKQTKSVNPIVRVLLMGLLKSGIFRRGIPYWLIKRLMKMVSKSIKVKSQVKWVKKEALIQDKTSGVNCVVSGHIHFPEVSLISAEGEEEQYYINTGTWRNVIPATLNFMEFGQLKALAKTFVFYPQERDALADGRDWSFHYMSGVSYGEHRHL